jgi:hypothetical protein
MASLVGVAFVGAFLAAGLGTVGVGVARLRKWWTMRRLDPAGAVAVEPGIREFEGRADAVDGTLTAPFTGAESLVCTHTVERYSPSHRGSNWRTVEEETRTVPFEVDHAGSSVAVDPAGARTLLTEEFHVDLAEADDPPDGVRSYVSQRLGGATAGDGPSVEVGPVELSGSDRYRFVEERLDDGETAYVIGTVRDDPDAVPRGSRARLAIDPRRRGWRERLVGDPFVVSDSGASTAARRQLRSALGVLGFGLAFSSIPAAMLALLFLS